jgi:hypothetical protein
MTITLSSSQSIPKNALLEKQTDYLTSLPIEVKHHYFSDTHITSETRAEIWAEQAELGEELVNQFSWATPDNRALKIIQHFASTDSHDANNGVVEIGCGANAYWSRQMHDIGINVLAFDSHLNQGGKIHNKTNSGDTNLVPSPKNNSRVTVGDNEVTEKNNKKRKLNNAESGDNCDNEKKCFNNGLMVYKGGPEVLSSCLKFKDMEKRVLFLCYPDEDVFIEEASGANADDVNVYNDDGDNDEDKVSSMGAACLEHFKGDTIIHVGELVGDTLSMDQAPWGRSSGPEFQQRLCAEYHCILKAKLTNWLHVRDTISVWKRSKCCSIVFQGDDDDDDDEEVQYKYIPQDEMLPNDIAAPCVKHLL